MTETQNQPPPIPNLEEILKAAMARRDYFASGISELRTQIEMYQKQVDAAQEIIDRLNGKPSKPKRNGYARRDQEVGQKAYVKILEALSKRSYAGSSTLAGASCFSQSTIFRAMATAVQNGHATKEVRGRRYRWMITQDGGKYVADTLPYLDDKDDE